jgi:hypothetical protein
LRIAQRGIKQETNRKEYGMAVRKSTLRARVRRGVAFLNERRPSWINSVSINKLDLGSCELCVLGQLYAHEDEAGYDRGLGILNGKVAKDPAKFGFNYFDSPEEYEELTKSWAEEIAFQRKLARQGKQVVTEAESFLAEPTVSATL